MHCCFSRINLAVICFMNCIIICIIMFSVLLKEMFLLFDCIVETGCVLWKLIYVNGQFIYHVLHMSNVCVCIPQCFYLFSSF